MANILFDKIDKAVENVEVLQDPEGHEEAAEAVFSLMSQVLVHALSITQF